MLVIDTTILLCCAGILYFTIDWLVTLFTKAETHPLIRGIGDGDVEEGCPEGLLDCDGTCVDARFDPMHCGTCDADAMTVIDHYRSTGELRDHLRLTCRCQAEWRESCDGRRARRQMRRQ